MTTVDLDSIKRIYETGIVDVYQVLKHENEFNIENVKNLIRDTLIVDKTSYVDYERDEQSLYLTILSSVIDEDIQRFSMLFLSSSFLLESILKLENSDDDRGNDIACIIANMFKNIDLLM